MKIRMDFFIIVMAVFFIMVHTEQAFSQQPNACQSNTICVHPGDSLNYSATLGLTNSSESFSFGPLIDSSHIRVMEQSQINGSEVKNYTMILSLKTGYAQSEQDVKVINPFFTILASPISFDKNNTSFVPTVVDFNGFKRAALAVYHFNENGTSKIEYDIESGILLERQTSDLLTINGIPTLVDYSDILTSTNMINSDSAGIKNIKSTISIPGWVKNNAKYWHDGTIEDSTFAQGIQFMIKQGIVTIPPTQNGQSTTGAIIPAWIKNNAGYWSTGDIDDETFVKGIQYLITSGIIQQ